MTPRVTRKRNVEDPYEPGYDPGDRVHVWVDGQPKNFRVMGRYYGYGLRNGRWNRDESPGWYYGLDVRHLTLDALEQLHEQAGTLTGDGRGASWRYHERVVIPGWVKTNPHPLNRSRPTWLYRYFDANDRLLYVGIAFDVLKRAQGHRRHAAWWSQAATYTEELYPTRTAAEAAEAEAIRAEAPLFNVVHNRRRVAA